MGSTYQPKENKLRNQVTEAKSILEQTLGTTKTKTTQVKRIKPLIDNIQLSNIKRAFWIGYLLGKHTIDYFDHPIKIE